MSVEVLSPLLLADGVYFGLDAATYHADPALGSSDMKLLAYSPADYWHGSALNPNRDSDEPTPAQVFGSAVHKLVLEGHQAFEGSYAPTDHNGSTKAGKAEREAIVEAGQTALKRDDWNRCLSAAMAIASNPHLAEAFTGGASEVSIVWTDDGLRKKARIDHLKARASTDLKSIRPQRAISFAQNCIRAFTEHRYDVQACHYGDARRAMADLIKAGAVFGDHDPAWLARLQAEAAFVFVFYRAEGAPLTHGLTLSPENPIIGAASPARDAIREAEANFRAFSDAFGPDRLWFDPAPLAELDIDQLPRWYGAN